MLIRSHLSNFAFDAPGFRELCAQLRSGALGPERCRLSYRPGPLPADSPSVVHPQGSEQAGQWRQAGQEALARGEVGVLILSGGMATRFGGGAKGCFSLLPGQAKPTFLSLKIAQVARLSAQLRQQGAAKIPVLIMDSFATQLQVRRHLEDINWMGLEPTQRGRFSQSILPRLRASTQFPLADDPKSAHWPDSILYCAPGHGDTLRRLKDSGTLNKLKNQGTKHLLISNVDNLLASLDPLLVGAHLHGVEQGKLVSIEAVPRMAGEAGGCVASLEQGPAIVESFRLPPETNLDDYPDFNTNTLWVDLRALDTVPELQWHPVKRKVLAPDGSDLECIQFEQLIGELSEHRPSQVLRVARDQRFLPIKRREALTMARPQIDKLIANWT